MSSIILNGTNRNTDQSSYHVSTDIVQVDMSLETYIYYNRLAIVVIAMISTQVSHARTRDTCM